MDQSTGRHALIIEDEMLIALEVEDLLQSIGFSTCDIAASPTEALDCAVAHRPDLITADMRIVGGTGLDAVKAIIGRMGRIPVVYITGNPEMLAGETGHPIVDKPIRPAALAEACAQVAA